MSSIWEGGKNRSLEYLCILKFWCFTILFYDVFYVKSAVKRLRHLYQKIVYADHAMGEEMKYQGSRFRDLSNSFHQNDIIEGRIERPDRGVLSENNTHIGKVNISHLSDDTIVCWPLTLKRGLCVSDHTGHVSQPFNQSPAYLAHTNPISLPILSWHRDYQHTWPPSSVLSRIS